MKPFRSLLHTAARPPAQLVGTVCSASILAVSPEVEAPAPDAQRVSQLGASSPGSSTYSRKVIHQNHALLRDVCPRCGGTGILTCHACGGAARLGRGGFHQRNPVNAARLVGSKWTAMERTLGWRHFHVTDKRKTAGETFVCMVSTCDGSKRLWMNASILKSRQSWAPGWLQKEEIAAATGTEDCSVECKACGGEGRMPCMLCNSQGAVVHL